MKKLFIALCLSMLTVAAFAARGPVEIKADIQKAKAAVKAAKATHSDATIAKTNLVALERELNALTPSRASHLDDGGETCDVATLIDVVPFFDGGVIDEETGEVESQDVFVDDIHIVKQDTDNNSRIWIETPTKTGFNIVHASRTVAQIVTANS